MPSSPSRWNRAAAIVVAPNGGRRPALPALPVGTPSLGTLFEFMRDAELRFSTLKVRIESRSITAAGDQRLLYDVAIRHPGQARVATSYPDEGPAANYELWTSDGETVRTYSGLHGYGTVRPVRRRLVGTDDPDLPGFARVYEPLTALPADSIPDTFIHPAGYCQNVLATGRCEVTGATEVAGRVAVGFVCHHPRTVELAGDRPDLQLELAVDRETGLISRLTERVGDTRARDSEAVALEPDAPLSDSLFSIAFPSNARLIF